MTYTHWKPLPKAAEGQEGRGSPGFKEAGLVPPRRGSIPGCTIRTLSGVRIARKRVEHFTDTQHTHRKELKPPTSVPTPMCVCKCEDRGLAPCCTLSS